MSPFSKLFEERGNSQQAYKTWLEAAQNTLTRARAEAEGHLEAAAALIAERQDLRTLNQLAYAGLCLWHLPLEHKPSPHKDPAWAANNALADLATKASKDPSKASQLATLEESLSLSAIALHARTVAENDYPAFQDKIFKPYVDEIANDEELHAIALKWPFVDHTQEKGMTEEQSNLIWRLNPERFSDRVVGALLRLSKKEGWSRLPPCVRIKADIRRTAQEVQGRPGSGCYSPRFPLLSFRPSVYYTDTFSAYFAGSPVKFASVACHEATHIIQFLSAARLGANSRNLYYPELMTNKAFRYIAHGFSQKKARYDQPILTYMQSGLHNCLPAFQAYWYRPSEYFSHRFSRAFESALATRWGFPQPKSRLTPIDKRLVASALTR